MFLKLHIVITLHFVLAAVNDEGGNRGSSFTALDSVSVFPDAPVPNAQTGGFVTIRED